jgi:hypothetical protein
MEIYAALARTAGVHGSFFDFCHQCYDNAFAWRMVVFHLLHEISLAWVVSFDLSHGDINISYLIAYTPAFLAARAVVAN